MPDKFNWMLEQCRGTMAWQLKACFERQGFIWELQDKALYYVLAAVGALIAGYAACRYRRAIECSIANGVSRLIKAKRRISRRISDIVDPSPHDVAVASSSADVPPSSLQGSQEDAVVQSRRAVALDREHDSIGFASKRDLIISTTPRGVVSACTGMHCSRSVR